LDVYKKHLEEFTDWLGSVEEAPTGAKAWDEALVDYKNAACLSRSKISMTIAAVEFFFPLSNGSWFIVMQFLRVLQQLHQSSTRCPCLDNLR
jgi:hypothetical protein